MAFPDAAEVAEQVEGGATGPSETGSDAAPDAHGGDTTAAAIAELDKVEKFKFEGKEYTPKELREWKQNGLRQQDYTRKTQEFSQERRFYDNLQADLRTVRSNPALAAEFRRTYPEKFHGYLEYLSGSQGNNQPRAPQNPGSSENANALDPRMQEGLTRLERLENERLEEKTAANESMLENQEKTMATKYPHADHERVYARAEAILDRNRSLPNDEKVKLTTDVFDRIYQADHEKTKASYEAYYKKQINEQKQAGLRARDSGSGGAVPGGAPRKFKSIREARDALLEDQGLDS